MSSAAYMKLGSQAKHDLEGVLRLILERDTKADQEPLDQALRELRKHQTKGLDEKAMTLRKRVAKLVGDIYNLAEEKLKGKLEEEVKAFAAEFEDEVDELIGSLEGAATDAITEIDDLAGEVAAKAEDLAADEGDVPDWDIAEDLIGELDFLGYDLVKRGRKPKLESVPLPPPPKPEPHPEAAIKVQTPPFIPPPPKGKLRVVHLDGGKATSFSLPVETKAEAERVILAEMGRRAQGVKNEPLKRSLLRACVCKDLTRATFFYSSAFPNEKLVVEEG